MSPRQRIITVIIAVLAGIGGFGLGLFVAGGKDGGDRQGAQPTTADDHTAPLLFLS